MPRLERDRLKLPGRPRLSFEHRPAGAAARFFRPSTHQVEESLLLMQCFVVLFVRGAMERFAMFPKCPQGAAYKRLRLDLQEHTQPFVLGKSYLKIFLIVDGKTNFTIKKTQKNLFSKMKKAVAPQSQKNG